MAYSKDLWKKIKISYELNERMNLFTTIMDYLKHYDFEDVWSEYSFESRVVKPVEDEIIIKFDITSLKAVEKIIITVFALDLKSPPYPKIETFKIVLYEKRNYIFEKGGK